MSLTPNNHLLSYSPEECVVDYSPISPSAVFRSSSTFLSTEASTIPGSQLTELPYVPFQPKRKQYGWQRKPTLYFYVNGHQGVSLENALRNHADHLEGKHEHVFDGCGDKISYHVHFEGYSPYKNQKYAYYQRRGQKFSNTREKVVRQVAEVMDEFIRKRQTERPDSDLRFGPEGVELKDLYLMELRHVACGMFQPVLAICRPCYRFYDRE